MSIYFLNHTLGYTLQKKMYAVIKNALCGEFNCHIKKYDKYNILECFLKHDFYTFYGSVLTLIGFAIFTEKILYVFKILSIHLAIPATCD